MGVVKYCFPFGFGATVWDAWACRELHYALGECRVGLYDRALGLSWTSPKNRSYASSCPLACLPHDVPHENTTGKSKTIKVQVANAQILFRLPNNTTLHHRIILIQTPTPSMYYPKQWNSTKPHTDRSPGGSKYLSSMYFGMKALCVYMYL